MFATATPPINSVDSFLVLDIQNKTTVYYDKFGDIEQRVAVDATGSQTIGNNRRKEKK